MKYLFSNLLYFQVNQGMIKHKQNLISVIESIKDKLKVFEYVQLQFYFREANSVVDSLANEGLKLEGQIWYDEFEQLFTKMKAQMVMDSIQMPSFW